MRRFEAILHSPPGPERRALVLGCAPHGIVEWGLDYIGGITLTFGGWDRGQQYMFVACDHDGEIGCTAEPPLPVGHAMLIEIIDALEDNIA